MPPILTWSKICADPALRDLPFKVELTPRGILEMSPARPRHGEYQGKITSLLSQLLPKGRVITECPIESVAGEVRVPDVAWIERGRERYNPTETALTVAPDICVEVLSWSNTPVEMTHKREFCAALGCREFWTCTEAGAVTFLDAVTGELLASSALCSSFPAMIDLD
jgi:Uma2 family endonuclease